MISALEVALFAWAALRGHTRLPLSAGTVRCGLLASGLPVVVMLASFPLAAVDPTYALLSWFVILPLNAILQRRAPRALRDTP